MSTVNGTAITVNGESREVAQESVDYYDIVKLAGMSGDPSVTWKATKTVGMMAAGSGGIVVPGLSLRLCEGMAFRVVHTGNA